MQINQSHDIPLHDIKMVTFASGPYEFFSSIFFILLFGLLFIYISYSAAKWLKFKNKKESSFTDLTQIDFKNSKESAYRLTIEGAYFRDKSIQHKEAYEKMVLKLEPYKYKKKVSEFDSETIKAIEEFRSLK